MKVLPALILSLLLPLAAFAQEKPAPAAEITPAPAAITPPTAPLQAPQTAQAPPPAVNFPALPPSRPCARPDVDGLWQLRAVLESPSGAQASDFANHPQQYFLFMRDDTFNTYKSTWADKSAQAVATQMREQKPEPIQQFVVHESGIVFFYVGGVISDTRACFIVANPQGTFTAGQMLLMPMEGQAPGRLVKVYERNTNVRVNQRATDNDSAAQDENEQAVEQPQKKRAGKKRRRARNRNR